MAAKMGPGPLFQLLFRLADGSRALQKLRRNSQDPLEPNARTLVDLLSARVLETPHRPAYVFAEHGADRDVFDYQRVWERVAGLAERIVETTGPGDRIALLCPPGPDFVCAFFACLTTRRIAVPVHLPMSAQQIATLRAILHDSGATAVIAPRSTVPVDSAQLGGGIAIIDSETAGRGLGFEPLPGSAPEPEDIAFLQYTSGSTGLPKGVMVRHRNLMVNLGTIRDKFHLAPDTSIVSWLPPYHDMGLIQGSLLPMFAGLPGTLMSPMTFLRDPMNWLREISGGERVFAGGPNLAYGLCVKRVSPADAATLDLSGWETAFVGAEPIDPRTLRNFADAFAVSGFRAERIVPVYGLAEATLYVSGAELGAGARSRHFSPADLESGVAIAKPAGRELIGVGAAGPEIAVVDPRTRIRCAENWIGEIWLSGASITAGYWDKPDATERGFRARIEGEDGTPYLRTGDLGFVCDGELYISGRSKELMIVHGRNIFPQDVERTILSGHPGLRPGGCAVFTARIDDQDRVMVVQELDEESESSAALADSIRGLVSREHALSVHRVVFVGKGQVPKTTSGKIQRQRLRETYSSETAFEESVR
ncbi:AMP-binding protein [Nocardia seriolae]|nr:AMP-binding protein [Nocardia seriolae]MTJ72577.1 AMP-binding protein [Nocardia seriolae]MTJ89618.1 AMP-binding protein [Nocardia seriolae]MTK33593.1 AMP-binding protein [Nocardia seriolae]MTK42741.1 AMP-binding protein [Nocardia seriolae]